MTESVDRGNENCYGAVHTPAKARLVQCLKYYMSWFLDYLQKATWLFVEGELGTHSRNSKGKMLNILRIGEHPVKPVLRNG